MKEAKDKEMKEGADGDDEDGSEALSDGSDNSQDLTGTGFEEGAAPKSATLRLS